MFNLETNQRRISTDLRQFLLFSMHQQLSHPLLQRGQRSRDPKQRLYYQFQPDKKTNDNFSILVHF